MAANTIDHATLVTLVEAGAVQGAHVVGRLGGWSVFVKYGMAERALAANRSRQVRVFRRMETLVGYLKDVGIDRFDVDAAEYDAAGGNVRTRPDRAEALRRAHLAAAHDKWFHEQVEIALAEADKPDAVWVDNDDARAGWAEKRARLVARIAGGDKA